MRSKRIMSLILAFVLSFSCMSMAAFAEETTAEAEAGTTAGTEADITDKYENCAESLYIYGLFKGGSKGFDLDTQSSKVQAAVMLVRLLGAEDDVLSNSFSHPYTDVPKWASNYVGYLYQNGIDISNEDTILGADDNISCADYVVMVLNALGYNDINKKMATEDVKAASIDNGLLTVEEVEQIMDTEFNRGTMVYISTKALDAPLADESGSSLFEQLQENGHIMTLEEPSDDVKYGTVTDIISDTIEITKPSLGDAIIGNAKKYLGIRYRSGGKSPSTGFDCSGFVGYVMIQSGVWNQFYGSCDGVMSKCTVVSKAEAKPGDIVFFKGTYRSSHKYTHVGIYLGGGQMIHSASSCGVSISNFTSGYWGSHYSCIARPKVLM